MDDTDDDLAVAATIVLSALSDKIKRKCDKWVQPWIAQHPISGAYHAFLQELQATDAKGLQNFLPMDMDVFQFSLFCRRKSAQTLQNRTQQ